MKKLLSLVVAGGLLVGSAAMASAADIKVKGQFDFGFGLYDGTNFTKHDGEESFDAAQRFRTQVDFIASEDLKGVAAFEIGNSFWGNGGGATWGGGDTGRGAGMGMGGDGVAVEVKHLYIDWLVPQTDLQVRMGLQPFALPGAVMRSDGGHGNYLMDDDMAGILLSYNFNEMVGINVGWYRPWDANTGNDGEGLVGSRYGHDDEVDAFILTLPIEMKDTFSLTPYGMYAMIGNDDNSYDANNGGGGASLPGDYAPWALSAESTLGEDGKAWWAGMAFDLSYFDPFVAAVDFTYGKYTADDLVDTNGGGNGAAGDSPDRSGWVALAKFGYKLDYFTPILFGWYGSGSDSNDEGLEGVMPYMSADWGLTSFGWSNAHDLAAREYLVGDSPAGSWAVGVGLEDIRFIDNLTSHLRVMYFEGTSDYEDGTDLFADYGFLTDKDSGFEVNLDNVINIYENLDMFVELAYINLDLKDEGDDFEDDAYKAYVGFTYSF